MAMLNDYGDVPEAALGLIQINDGQFKPALDRYKYPERFPEMPQAHYRAQCEVFLGQLNALLDGNHYLLSDKPSAADLAVFPFVRQFSRVDTAWFDASHYVDVQRWLAAWQASDLFATVMRKALS